MVTISDSSLRQNAYETLYDSIKTVCAGLLGSTVTVTAAYVTGDTALPQVVVNAPEVDYSDFSFDRANSTKEIRVLVDVYTKKAKDKDVITDAIANTISTTNYAGMMLVGITESNAVEPIEDVKVHLKSLAITYARR